MSERAVQTEPNEREYVDCPECAECGCLLPHEEDRMHYDVQTFCVDCFDERFANCDDCRSPIDTHGSYIAFYTVRTHRGDITVCEDCIGEYHTCTFCDEYVDTHNVTFIDGFTIACNECAENLAQCHTCGAIVPIDDSYYDEYNDVDLCSYCWHSSHTSFLHDYCYKPSPIFYGDVPEGKASTPFYAGLELEIDNGDDRRSCAHDLDAITEAIYLKTDASLNHGIEIVTHPCTLDYHLNTMPYDRIRDVARDYGFLSHDADTCGLHIHVNRDYFGTSVNAQDLQIAKLLILIDHMWDELVTFSRRSSYQLDSYAQKNSFKHEAWEPFAVIQYKLVEQKALGRYQALNITNEHTIEFRLFRGTLNVDTIKATIQLVHHMCKYVKRHSLAKVQTTNWNYLRSTFTDKELIDYCEKRGI